MDLVGFQVVSLFWIEHWRNEHFTISLHSIIQAISALSNWFV